MAHLLALDQGTTSSRAIVFDESGSILGVAQPPSVLEPMIASFVADAPDELGLCAVLLTAPPEAPPTDFMVTAYDWMHAHGTDLGPYTRLYEVFRREVGIAPGEYRLQRQLRSGK